MQLPIEDIIKLWILSESSDNTLSQYFTVINNYFIGRIKKYSLFSINRLTNNDAEDLSSIAINKIHFRIKNISKPPLEIKRFFSYSFMVIRNSIIDFTKKKKLLEQSENKPQKAPKKIRTQKVKLSSKQILERFKCWGVVDENNYSDEIQMSFMSIENAGYKITKTPTDLISKYYLWFNNDLDDRYYMWEAIYNMRESIKEERIEPKPDPMVGAVLVDENGFVIANSWRGKDRPQGKGHCEYVLFEHEMKKKEQKKYVHNRYIVPEGLPGAGTEVTELNIRNATLYVTLEPCSDRNGLKCSCADRIIYSGIKTVYVGLKDPNKRIDGNGIKKMEQAGITVKYFHQDLLFEIIRAKNKDGEQQNLEFIKSKIEFYLKEQPELFVNYILGL